MRFKNIRIPKRGGGTRTQRVQVLKSGKYKFVKNITKSKSKAKKPKTKTKRRKTMAKKKTRRRNSFTLPLAPLIGFGVGLVEGASRAYYGDFLGAVDDIGLNYIGYSVKAKQFKPAAMVGGLLPLVIGLLVHKFVGGAPLNANRMLAAAKVPVLRI